jgi:hypothetical protein
MALFLDEIGENRTKAERHLRSGVKEYDLPAFDVAELPRTFPLSDGWTLSLGEVSKRLFLVCGEIVVMDSAQGEVQRLPLLDSPIRGTPSDHLMASIFGLDPSTFDKDSSITQKWRFDQITLAGLDEILKFADPKGRGETSTRVAALRFLGYTDQEARKELNRLPILKLGELTESFNRLTNTHASQMRVFALVRFLRWFPAVEVFGADLSENDIALVTRVMAVILVNTTFTEVASFIRDNAVEDRDTLVRSSMALGVIPRISLSWSARAN